MQESTPREKVLKRIRKALIHKTNSPFPQVDFESSLYSKNQENPAIVFASELMAAGGHFIFCENKFDFAEQLISLGEQKKWKHMICPDKNLRNFLLSCEFPLIAEAKDYKETQAVITFCECLVARTGSILISSRQAHGRKLPAIAQAHIVVAFIHQLKEEIKDALQLMKTRYASKLPSMMTFITGPSKTADIELTKVTGAHGPSELFVFLIEEDEMV
jgi:L-lactate dehydrogenase complex protein LldG